MYRNGVSHMTASDDFEGVSKIVDWMSYVPDKKGATLPVAISADSWDRGVAYYPPPKQAYDVRWLIAGKEDDEGFLSGLFDKGSFEEALGGWARTVVIGRARLGGIPMGVIAVETRSVENTTPADPANPDSMEQISQEAGGVWYPNSAFKTAQALQDFNNGEQLPVMILANWRGFSGGQRDMYNEVLKYGSYIVDALVKFQQPVFVYIPPFGELRGGSWVVVDPTINPDYMEMYADEDSRGGVLEPEGIVGIKYRKERQLETMARTDSEYAHLKQQLADKATPKEQLEGIKQKMTQRENLLLPVYNQIALQFADLHDRAGRMEAKGTIRMPLQWKNARRFFFWRLRRRVNEELLLKKMDNGTSTSPPKQANSRARNFMELRSWMIPHIPDFETNDRAVAEWFERNQPMLKTKLDAFKANAAGQEMTQLLRRDKAAAYRGMKNMLDTMPAEEKERLVDFLIRSKGTADVASPEM